MKLVNIRSIVDEAAWTEPKSRIIERFGGGAVARGSRAARERRCDVERLLPWISRPMVRP
jgi:hypothetical protein